MPNIPLLSYLGVVKNKYFSKEVQFLEANKKNDNVIGVCEIHFLVLELQNFMLLKS
jgi:hypothetical protein